jgi:citrate lyase subunit beta/citryl-CoA lyase
MVRINQGKLGLKDLVAVIPHNVHLILVPKVEVANQLKAVDDKIQQIRKDCGRKEPVYLMPILESAKGILNSLEIAKASKNNVAIAIGLEDYTADIGVQRTNQGRESLFARSQVVNAVKSVGIQAIDTVFSDVNDEDGLRASIREAKELGFEGKGCIHPRQIKPIHEEFSPSKTEIEKSKKIVLSFDAAEKRGLGVVSLGSKMIDPPVVKRALKTVDLAIATKLLNKNWKKN